MKSADPYPVIPAGIAGIQAPAVAKRNELHNIYSDAQTVGCRALFRLVGINVDGYGKTASENSIPACNL